MKTRFRLKNSMNIFLVLTLLSSAVAGTSSATTATELLVGKSCLSSEVGKSVVYKASMGRSIYSTHVKSYLACKKYQGKFLWMSTITLKTIASTKPSKNTATITPTVVGTQGLTGSRFLSKRRYSTSITSIRLEWFCCP